ncbi:unnamed protein product [Amoebophrya sp. A25]|nr:unnamed protein product [Amoebophrya sp. A25]|eukprot:GSA25T00013472001.1
MIGRRKGILGVGTRKPAGAASSAASKELSSSQNDVELENELRRKQMASKLEWEELLDNEEMRKRRREAAANMDAIDYRDAVDDDKSSDGEKPAPKRPRKGSEEDDAVEKGAAAPLQLFPVLGDRNKNKTNNAGQAGGSSSSSSAAFVSNFAGGRAVASNDKSESKGNGTTSTKDVEDESDEEQDEQPKKRGIRGGTKEAKKAKKARKKKEKDEEKRQNMDVKSRKRDEDQDKFKKVLLVQGEDKPRTIDTRRLCTYIDRDAPKDLRKLYGGNFREAAAKVEEEREVADYDDLD